MKIVIDIDKKDYEFIKSVRRIMKNGSTFQQIAVDLFRATQEGTPLPKGHGRLIDADDLIQDILDDNQLCLFNSEAERIVHDEMVNFAVDRLADCSTIIEADKSEVN